MSLPPPQLPPPAQPPVPPAPVFQPGTGKMPRRQKRILLGIGAGFVVFLVVANALGWGADEDPTPARPSTVRVVYQVSGTADVGSLTFETPTGSAQRNEQRLPTEVEFEFRPGAYVGILVQNDTDSGDVECVIRVNGKIVSQNEAAGAYAIAQCAGRV